MPSYVTMVVSVEVDERLQAQFVARLSGLLLLVQSQPGVGRDTGATHNE